MKKLLSSLTALVLGLGIQANATVYFQSDFNGLPDSTKVVNGGLVSITAYGLPNQYGVIRSSALTIYGGEQHNGANTGGFGSVGSGFAADLAAGKSILRATGQYKTGPAFNNTPWNQTAKIQFNNPSQSYALYNEIVVSADNPNWTSFTLDLDLAFLNPTHFAGTQFNVYMFEYNPGEFSIDNLTIQTVVPEPSSAALMGLGLAGLLAFRLRRKV